MEYRRQFAQATAPESRAGREAKHSRGEDLVEERGREARVARHAPACANANIPRMQLWGRAPMS